MHSILRLDNEHEPIPPKVGWLAGFQAQIQSKPQNSKPYYLLSLPTAPHKSEVHEAMSCLAYVNKERRMPFQQLVGDQPVYALIFQLRNEDRKAFEKTLPILGPLHSQWSFMAAINKLFLVLVYLKYWSQQMWLLQNLSEKLWNESIFSKLSEGFSFFMKLYNAGWYK